MRFQGRAYSHRWGAVSHWVNLLVNDMAGVCWQAGDKEVPLGISCHSFSPGKAAESSYLIFCSVSSLEHLSTSFEWIEKFTTTKPSTLIKSGAKPSTAEEHNIWGRWVIPPAQSKGWRRISNVHNNCQRRRRTHTHTQVHIRCIL